MLDLNKQKDIIKYLYHKEPLDQNIPLNIIIDKFDDLQGQKYNNFLEILYLNDKISKKELIEIDSQLKKHNYIYTNLSKIYNDTKTKNVNKLNYIIKYAEVYTKTEIYYTDYTKIIEIVLLLEMKQYNKNEIIELSNQLDFNEINKTMINILSKYNKNTILKLSKYCSFNKYSTKSVNLILDLLENKNLSRLLNVEDKYDYLINDNIVQNYNTNKENYIKNILQCIKNCDYNNINLKELHNFLPNLFLYEFNPNLVNKIIKIIKNNLQNKKYNNILDIYHELDLYKNITFEEENDSNKYQITGTMTQKIVIYCILNNIKVTPIIEYIKNNKKYLHPIKFEYIYDNRITNKKDANSIIKFLDSEINIEHEHLKNLIENLLQVKNNITLPQLIKILQLTSTQINNLCYIVKDNDVDEMIKVVELFNININKFKNIDKVISFIRENKFNKNKIYQKLNTKNIDIETILLTIDKNYNEQQLQYLFKIESLNRYKILLNHDFDITKTVEENLKKIITQEKTYKKFKELSNNKYDNIDADKILDYYLNDILNIYVDFKQNRNVNDRTKKLFESIFEKSLTDEFKEYKFKTLELELDEDIGSNLKEKWINNESYEEKNYKVYETYDFKTTMNIGKIPTTTCMNYKNGMYSESLISNFDANKKIIIVKNQKGDIVARSIIKLTKMRKGNLSFNDNVNLNKNFAVIIEKIYNTDNNLKFIEHLICHLLKNKFKNTNVKLISKKNLYDGEETQNKEEVKVKVFVTFSRGYSQYFDSIYGTQNNNGYGHYHSSFFYILNE